MLKTDVDISIPKGQKLDEQMKKLRKNPKDVDSAYDAGILLREAGREEDALEIFTGAFNNAFSQQKFEAAFKIAEDILSIDSASLEVLHRLSQIAEKHELDAPVLEIYNKFTKCQDVPLLASLNNLDLLNVLKAGNLYKFKMGKKILKEGKRGDEIYLITKGSVKVSKKTGKGRLDLGFLKKGDFLGEIGYMTNKRRSATIVADEPTEMLGWKRDTIKRLSQDYPEVGEELYNAFQQRSLSSLLSLSPVFASLNEEQKAEIQNKFEVKYFKANDIILREGEPSADNAIYLIKRGEASVFTKSKGDLTNPMTVLRAGDVFGEFSALTGKAPTATVMAKTSLEAFALSRSHLVDVIEKYPEVGVALEKAGSVRISDTFLYMGYFKILEDIKDSRGLETESPESD
jgi:CRP-like cAMP-binding protein